MPELNTDKKSPDPEMLKNLDLLLDYDLLENESDWETLEEESVESEGGEIE